MIKWYSANGLTANQALSPAQNYKWKILRLVAYIVTSTGSGTREVVVYLDVQNITGTMIQFVPSISSTLAVSGDYVATGGDVAAAGLGGAASAYQQWGSPPVIGSQDQILIRYTLISGDLGGYYLEVEEELA